jgi:hypothetical protein
MIPTYVGESKVLHFWPRSMLVLALVPIALGSLGGVIVFVVPALIAGALLPWRFAVFDDGIALWFGLGRHRFLAKEDITIRAGLGGTVLFPRGATTIGYPLTDGFVERRRASLRAVLFEHGFRVVS